MGCKVIFHDANNRLVCGVVAEVEHEYYVTDYLKLRLFGHSHGIIYRFTGDVDTINNVIESIYDNDKVDLRYYDIKAQCN